MLLTRALSPHLASASRQKGAAYFERQAIVHFDPQGSLVYAVVRGGDDYVVRIEVDGATIRGTCSCPYFSDRLEPCKHIWAVALECDAHGVLSLPDSIAPTGVGFMPIRLDADGEPIELWSPLDDPEFARRLPPPTPMRAGRPARRGPWVEALERIAASSLAFQVADTGTFTGRLLYIVDRAASRNYGALFTWLLRQDIKANGEWSVPKPARLQYRDVQALSEADRYIVERVGGAHGAASWQWSGAGEVPSPFQLGGAQLVDLLERLCATGRLLLARTDFPSARPQDGPLVPLTWDGTEWYRCSLDVTRDEAAGVYRIELVLVRGDERVPMQAIDLLLPDGVACISGRVCRFAPGPLLSWAPQVDRAPLQVPLDEAERLRAVLIATGGSDLPSLPDELRTSLVAVEPVPHLVLALHERLARTLTGEVGFRYDGGPLVRGDEGRLVATRHADILARRQFSAEQRAHERLTSLGVRTAWDPWTRTQRIQIGADALPRIARPLIEEGWHVEADGRAVRVAGSAPTFEIRSGIDWFELHGDVAFDEQRVALPALLAAVQERRSTVMLPDGSIGLLPESLPAELAPLAIGARHGDHLRFQRSQVALLDALLAARPVVAWDDTATAARDRLRAFDRITPVDPPPSFTGQLRPYQRDALGWTAFLREFRFGGCLADDMGLGKTVVVLALLDARRVAREADGQEPRPSLVVVPRSVLFNWQQEAARFAPRLRVLDFSGSNRAERMRQIGASDLVLVTYGTLRRDAAALADIEFDYVVLDEAQTIKNTNTAASKAARLLRGQHRLALSGTPVENRLTDLWSLFEFLNPGLLSGSTAFARAFTASASDEAQRAVLARGLRPFILRRTKEQVARDLPERTEQTIVCDLEKPQRALYNELRDHFRRRLLAGGATWQQSKLQVLEALLRLRQAACHPALVDPARSDDGSAKLDLLMPRLVETVDEGHKALVFSQFTSFLALLRTRLEQAGLVYEYLDGRTRDREARVSRFQGDPSCRLFLISLKAGGVGLNLTAADYVFILDPWWNPAAEAQAIDRTHRIGQTRRVFAYRLIARDTVEERVVELQRRKKALADAIVTADAGLVQMLNREDLELLLS